MVALDALVGHDRAEHDPPRPRRLDRGARVDGERLQPELRGAADDRRRRSATASGAGACSRPAWRCSSLASGRLRARGQRRLADRGARRAGGRRGAGDAAGAGAAERGVSRAKTRGTAIGIFSGVTGTRLIAGPVVGGAIAEGIAWQWIFWLNSPDRPGRHSARARAHAGELRRRHRASTSPGLVLVTRRCSRHGVGAGARQHRGLGERRGARGAGRRRSCSTAAFVAWELRAREPMLPMRFFRSRAFSAGNAASFLFYAVAVWHRVLLAAVPADRAGLRPARRRPAAAAVDGHAVPGRPDRRRRSSTGSASGRSSSAACCCKPPDWPGSPSSPRPASPTPNWSRR